LHPAKRSFGGNEEGVEKRWRWYRASRATHERKAPTRAVVVAISESPEFLRLEIA
jgi:hypothetical protein